MLRYEREIQDLLESLESRRAIPQSPGRYHRYLPRAAWVYALASLRRLSHTSVILTVPALSLALGLLLMFGSGFLLPKAVIPVALLGGILIAVGSTLLLVADRIEGADLAPSDDRRRRGGITH